MLFNGGLIFFNAIKEVKKKNMARDTYGDELGESQARVAHSVAHRT